MKFNKIIIFLVNWLHIIDLISAWSAIDWGEESFEIILGIFY